VRDEEVVQGDEADRVDEAGDTGEGQGEVFVPPGRAREKTAYDIDAPTPVAVGRFRAPSTSGRTWGSC
jgi:hypothetical protein